MANWDVKITTPNGTNAHFVMDEGDDEQTIIDFFTNHVRTIKVNDPPQLAGIPGVPPATQPLRKP